MKKCKICGQEIESWMEICKGCFAKTKKQEEQKGQINGNDKEQDIRLMLCCKVMGNTQKSAEQISKEAMTLKGLLWK